jgi:hypothetical protein
MYLLKLPRRYTHLSSIHDFKIDNFSNLTTECDLWQYTLYVNYIKEENKRKEVQPPSPNTYIKSVHNCGLSHYKRWGGDKISYLLYTDLH